ncbi:MAG: dinitrogenase iron-molybdenum cofactor [Candidatus Altiarchaeales archaeon]|nr:dinitrogenase iron-molybdenum cofactor [Candidatus Altiarchaeales archaeon]MBD3415771.1 dinitrogenase iron-molybdenum cofactor [Candidatus Altiarchaeales archaeon]
MKVVIATNEGGLEDGVSPVFGRCRNFTVAECEGGEVAKTEVVGNTGFSSAGGAGIQAAQQVNEMGAKAVIAGNFGPNAAAVLSQGGVEMIQYRGNAGEAAREYAKGILKPVEGPTVRDHFGGGRRGFGGRGQGRRRGGT